MPTNTGFNSWFDVSIFLFVQKNVSIFLFIYLFILRLDGVNLLVITRMLNCRATSSTGSYFQSIYRNLKTGCVTHMV
jgi:hypothetical protein